MKSIILLLLILLPARTMAIPNSVFGPVAAANSPLNGQDLTPELTAAALWAGNSDLPGTWKEEGRIAAAEISHLLARPKLFGREVVLLRATKRDGRLVALDATFADAGSFFGYFDQKLPENLDRRAQREELERRVAARQAEFSATYTETLDALRDELAKTTGSDRPRLTKIGHTRTLRTETEDHAAGDLTFRLLAADQRLIRITVARSDELPKSWLDPEVAALAPRERQSRLLSAVRKTADGTVAIEGLQPLPQGYRPYCGLNSLAMAARHFGLHVDEDWLAAAGGFKNTGSADGSRILQLYPAVAAEAGLSLDRSSRFDEAAIHRALASGFPVVVWRRFSHERDQLHTRFARTHARDPDATLPDPAQASERASWPDSDSRSHAAGFLTKRFPQEIPSISLGQWNRDDRIRVFEDTPPSGLAGGRRSGLYCPTSCLGLRRTRPLSIRDGAGSVAKAAIHAAVRKNLLPPECHIGCDGFPALRAIRSFLSFVPSPQPAGFQVH